MHSIISKILSIVFIATFLVALSPIQVNADLVNPGVFSKQCAVGEKKVGCGYSREKPFGPIINDGCKKYENNPNYYYLAGSGGSFGGSSVYCLKAGAQEINTSAPDVNTGAQDINITYIIIGAILVLVIVISVYILRIIRKKK